jgi:hypothetical protein
MAVANRATRPVLAVRVRAVGVTTRRNRWAGNVSVRSATLICTFNTPASAQFTGDILTLPSRLAITWSAEVAQLVEHVTENHGVGSSILPLGTRFINKIA